MVVMAIIAILATAGLSGYTGYLKKARDAKRIADIAAINNIVLASMSVTGMPPKSNEISALVTAANNGVRLQDPLYPKLVCGAAGVTYNCSYYYLLCDGGTGYLVTAFLESPSNASLLAPSIFPHHYKAGSCKVHCYELGSLSCGASQSEWGWREM